MPEDIAAPYIPAQHVGEETETSEQREVSDETTAKEWFDILSQRLQDVNKWHEWSGVLSSEFQLMDASGNKITATAALGQYIQIDIPGPGTIAGKGYDWVYIERAEHLQLNADQELFVLQARPAKAPFADHDGTSHFLDSQATSSFVIKRDKKVLTATVYGRNEVPNVDAEHSLDKVRNAVVGSSGAIGVSKLQWKALVTGLFSDLNLTYQLH